MMRKAGFIYALLLFSDMRYTPRSASERRRRRLTLARRRRYHNPCPPGWRVPTQGEWAAESEISSYTTAYSTLKLTLAGYRDRRTTSLGGTGNSGVNPSYSYSLSGGYPVRCRK